MGYKITNISKTMIHDNLDTRDGDGDLGVFALGPRESVEVTDAQFESRRLQKHLKLKRLKAQKIA